MVKVVIDGGPGFSGAVVDSRPSGVDSRSYGVDSHPSGVDSRPSGVEFPPYGLEFRPYGLESRPSGVDSRPSGIEVLHGVLGFLPVAPGILSSVAPLHSFHLPHCSSWATIGAGVTSRVNLGRI